LINKRRPKEDITIFDAAVDMFAHMKKRDEIIPNAFTKKQLLYFRKYGKKKGFKVICKEGQLYFKDKNGNIVPIKLKE